MTPGDLVRIRNTRRIVELVHPLPTPRDDGVCEVDTKGWCVLDDGVFRYFRIERLGPLK